MCSSAPSVSRTALPSIDRYRYALSRSQTTTETRGSRVRLCPLARNIVVLKTTFSPSQSIQTTVACGDPSRWSVVTTAKLGSSSNRACSSVSVVIAVLPRVQPRCHQLAARCATAAPGRATCQASRRKTYAPNASKGVPMVAADYPFLDVLWTMIVIFAWVIWFWLLITVFADLFRRHDTSGGMKALWVIFVIVLPFVGVLIYLIAN